MKWVLMNITDMEEFDTDSFDLAIDKSTIDALLCGDDSFLNVALMLKETQRVLKPGGHYFAISYGKPDARVYHFERPFLSWDLREFILYEANVETEEEKLRRYDRVMEKLRKMMQHERRLLKAARLQYNKELASKTELEILLKQAVDKVKSERK